MNQTINGSDYVKWIENGAKKLFLDIERINSLNVFPVPDGDTGTNMKMTIDGGVKEGLNNDIQPIGEMAKKVARAMVLSARGNSGVILSQFFRGLANGLEGLDECDPYQLAKAFEEGTKRSYQVVSNPTEGTILTVMRESSTYALSQMDENKSFDDFFKSYLKEAHESLRRTPDLLPVLKEAGVIDSGGAGFILIIDGMYKALNGEYIDIESEQDKNSHAQGGFNANSELTYGYCTEFVLQLQNSKVDPKNFDLNILTDFLKSIGNSIVAFKDDDLIKVHVHTFDPGLVLLEGRKYGEFLTIKIENMNVQHSENDTMLEYGEIGMGAAPTVKKEHKKYALVTVSNGSGFLKLFKELGVDEVISGGQTMNTSTNDFIEAFKKIDADYIFVYPNNSNIYLAAKQAADNYKDAKVIVIKTKTIAEGYSAISMFSFEGMTLDEVLASQEEVISNVNTIEVTYSIRDAKFNGVEVKKGDYICICKDKLICADSNRINAVKKAFDILKDELDIQVVTVFCGQDVAVEEANQIEAYLKTLDQFIEVYPLQGNQDIYSYIIGIE